MEPLLREKAKANQQERKGSQPGTTPHKCVKLSPVETREELAKTAGVEKRLIDEGKIIAERHKCGKVKGRHEYLAP